MPAWKSCTKYAHPAEPERTIPFGKGYRAAGWENFQRQSESARLSCARSFAGSDSQFEVSAGGLNAPIISDLLAKVKDFGDIAKLLTDAIDPEAPNTLKDGGYIRPGFNQELDEYRALRENSKTIIAQMEQRERAETGIKNLKISYNRIFGYFIEVTNSFKNMVPYHYIRKQTLANAERYITEELKTLEEKILNSNEQALRLEARLFAEIKEKLLKEIESLTDASDSLGVLDCLNAFATVARENHYVRPQIVEGGRALNIVDGRHPVVEALSSEQFIPNDTYLDTGENRTMIITGPNMAGKSTYMRQVALIVLMAHIGSFVPARSAEIPLVDRIFTRIGASDNLVLDQSTFMVEMTEVANILLNATEKSLLILDEVGRGTSTYDGLSIAWAVVEYITKNLRAKTLFATHYHELTELEGVFDGVKNYKITVRELNNTIVFSVNYARRRKPQLRDRGRFACRSAERGHRPRERNTEGSGKERSCSASASAGIRYCLGKASEKRSRKDPG